MPGLDPISAIANTVGTIVDKIWPDKTEVEKNKLAEFQAELQASLQDEQNNFQLALEQVKSNAVEASSQSVFVAGWRPAIGWICGLAFAWSYVLAPMGTWIALMMGKSITPPVLDIGGMMPVLLGMLGLGAMRSVDKIKTYGSTKDSHGG
jgi:hypothetical protein